jgi:hypothetical protein
MQPLLSRITGRRVALVAALALAFCGSIACESVARAQAVDQPQLDRARAAYDRGMRAHALRDHVTAARAFAEADALAPAPASLEAALESSMRADDALLGAELVDRAEGRAGDPGVARSLAAARKRFGGRTGKVSVDCRGESRCVASIDGTPADARKVIYVIAGPHAVVLQRGEERVERLVEVKADATVVVGGESSASLPSTSPNTTVPTSPAGPSAGPAGPAGPDKPSSGVSPVWFFVGLGVTGVVGAATLVSGLDAVSKHDSFGRDGCGTDATGPKPQDCDQRGRDGESAQRRTNVLLGATAVLAVATAAVGIFVVRWKDGTKAQLTVGATRSAALAGFELVTP